MGDAGAWPLWIPMILLLGLLIVILVGVYWRNRAALTPAAWGYASRLGAAVERGYQFSLRNPLVRRCTCVVALERTET